MQEPCDEADVSLVPWFRSSELLGLTLALGFEETAWHLRIRELKFKVMGPGQEGREGSLAGPWFCAPSPLQESSSQGTKAHRYRKARPYPDSGHCCCFEESGILGVVLGISLKDIYIVFRG